MVPLGSMKLVRAETDWCRQLLNPPYSVRIRHHASYDEMCSSGSRLSKSEEFQVYSAQYF